MIAFYESFILGMAFIIFVLSLLMVGFAVFLKVKQGVIKLQEEEWWLVASIFLAGTTLLAVCLGVFRPT